MRINRSGNYVLRGHTQEDEQLNGQTKHINVNTGTYKDGFRIVDFRVSSESRSPASEVCGIVALSDTAVTSADIWNWNNQQQIAWASADQEVVSVKRDTYSVCDSSVVVVDELFIFAHNTAGTNYRVNYYIELEPVDLKAFEYAMNYIQNKSQG